MDRSGTSGIVITVLLILITITGLSIVALSLNQGLKNNARYSSSCIELVNNLRFSQQALACHNDNLTAVTVTRTGDAFGGFALLFKSGEINNRFDILPDRGFSNLKSASSSYGESLPIPLQGESITYVYGAKSDLVEIYPLNSEGVICNIADSLVVESCSASEAQLLQAISGSDGDTARGGGNGSGEGNNFNFVFTSDGLLKELNWTDGSNWRRIIWDELGRFGGSGIRYYLHSLTSSNPNNYQEGWSYKIGSQEVTIPHTQINYHKITDLNNSVTISATTDAIDVSDVILFSGDSILINITVKNNLNQDIQATIPFNFGSLQIGNFDSNGEIMSSTGLSRLRAWKGGEIQSPFNDSGGAKYSYPKGIDAFSPVTSIWDSETTIGVQYVNKIQLPDYVDFLERAKWTKSPSIQNYIHIELAPGKSKTFSVVIKFAQTEEDSWKNVLGPYKSFFNLNYNSGTPQYCPTGPFAYYVGVNSQGRSPSQYNPGPCTWDSVSGSCLPNSNYNSDPGIGANRYYPNTKFMDVFAYGYTLANIQSLELPYYGIWSASLWPGYLNSSCEDPALKIALAINGVQCEFSPAITIFDPRLNISDGDSLKQASQSFNEVGAKLFWYTRPCSDIIGSQPTGVDLPIGSPYTQGTFIPEVNLEDASARNMQFAKYDYLVQRGISDFYIDYISCPGEEDFVSELVTRYPDSTFISREGARDTMSIISSQAPLIKSPNYPQSHSELISWLTPYATYYAGNLNHPLSDSEIEDSLNRGYQPVISNTLEYNNPTTLAKWKLWMCEAYSNQLERYNAYGVAEGCSPPVKPSYCS